MKYALLAAFGALAFASCAPANTGPSYIVKISSTGALASTAASTVSGSASVVTMTDGTAKVVVNLTGMEPNSKHAMHIHVGSCANQGPVVIGLPDIAADANGNGSIEKMVETAKIPAAAYINIHQKASDAGVGGGIACGNVR
jgi:Cu/Zn superoxide dismutase